MRAVWHGGKIEEFVALAHVASTPRYKYQGPTRATDAVQFRSGTGVQPAAESRSQGTTRIKYVIYYSFSSVLFRKTKWKFVTTSQTLYNPDN